jgi:hypothetical protein
LVCGISCCCRIRIIPRRPEFEAYPPHAIAGTREAETIPELLALPFAEQFTVIEKNALAPWHQHGVRQLAARPCGDIDRDCGWKLHRSLHLPPGDVFAHAGKRP